MRYKSWAITLGLLFSALLFGESSTTKPDAAYLRSLAQWKTHLIADRKENWLSLAGLFWLRPGENSFGMDANNSIALPKGPEYAGFFILQDGVVTVRASAEAHAMINGKPVTTAKLDPDVSGNPTVIAMRSLRMHVIKRQDRIGVRVKDLENPSIRNHTLPTFYPPDLNFRATATWVPSDGKTTIEVPDVLGDVSKTPIAGGVTFSISGQQYHLIEMEGHPEQGMFFVFGDLTNKSGTYPSGRFLRAGPVTNGTVVLDFNRAYNPPCAVTPYATCPLPPKENRLSVAIPAGEKYDHH